MDAYRLESSFPAQPHLPGPRIEVEAVVTEARQLVERFDQLHGIQIPGLSIKWGEPASPRGSLMGTAHLKTRIQPFALLLDLYGRRPRIRCISPVGRVHPDAHQKEVIKSAWRLGARIGAILELETGTYDLTVEEDVLLGSGPKHDAARLMALLSRVLEQADRLEQDYLPGHDRPLEFFLDDIEKDIVNAR